MISNRGTKVYPGETPVTDCVDHWRCRFVLRHNGREFSDEQILPIVSKIGRAHRWMHIEKLPLIDGEMGFTKAQGED